MSDISLFEAIHSQRAIRNFSPDPVPDEVVAKILDAAIRAPSGGNTQRWSFLVIRDRETKRRFGEWYVSAWSKITAEMDFNDRATQPYWRSMLTENMEDIPVLILACLEQVPSAFRAAPITSGSSIYPAVQNILLAARALGLGTVLTTLHTQHEDEVKEYLGIPDNVATAALIPLGYPAEGQRFSRARRRPASEVTFHERWGQRAGE